MRLAVLTSLYPSPPRPHEGSFAERRYRGMRARGHEVTVVQPVPFAPALLIRGERADFRQMPSEEDRSGVRVRRPRYLHLPGRALANARAFGRAARPGLLADGRPDVVLMDYAWPAGACAPALAASGLQCVVNGRGSDVLQVRREPRLAGALGAGLRAAGRWCAVSDDLVQAMDALAGSPGRGRLIANGVDLELFQPGDRQAARRSLDLPSDAALVLVVGHLIARKDPLLAIAAFASGAPPGSLLAFVGRGELASAIEQEAARLGLEGRVLLAGERTPEELSEWYAACDLLLLTSSREGRPNVVLEALACGRPVVATAAGGTGELLEGLPDALVHERTPGAIGARIASLIASPPGIEELRGRVACMSWERSCEELERFLEEAAQ